MPFPSTAFTSENGSQNGSQNAANDAPIAPGRFSTRRIGAEDSTPARSYRGAAVDLDLKNADLPNVFRLLADVGHVSIIVAGEIGGTVTMRLRHVPWDQALDVIVRAKNLDMERDGGVIVIRSAGPRPPG